MTTIYVDNIAPNLQSKISAPNLKPPAGSVAQVVSSGGFTNTVTVSSTTFTGTGHSIAITPKYDNSYILLQLAGGGWYDNGNGLHSQWLTFYRSINGGAYTSLANIGTTYGLQRMSADGNQWNIKPHSAQWLDPTGQTAGTPITYQVYTRVSNNSSQYNAGDRGTPVFIAQEIVQ